MIVYMMHTLEFLIQRNYSIPPHENCTVETKTTKSNVGYHLVIENTQEK